MSRADVGVVRAGPVQHAPVVPDDHVAHLPLVAVHAIGCGRAVEEVVEQGPALVDVHARRRGRRWRRARASCRPERWRHTSGCSFAGRWRQLATCSGVGFGVVEPLRRLDGVHDADRVGPRLLVVGEGVVGAVGAGELGLAAGLGHRVGAQQRGHDRDVVGAPVDVPVEGALAGTAADGFFCGSRVTRKISGFSPLPNTSTAPRRLLNATWVASSMWRSRNTRAPLASSASRIHAGQRLVLEQSSRVDARDQGADSVAQLLCGDHGHAGLLVRCHGRSGVARARAAF